MLLEPFQRKAPQASVESLHDLVVRRIGSGFASEILPALMAGFLPADPVHIAASVFPGLERWDRFGGFLWIAGRLAAERNVVPEGGMGSLASTLAARIKSRETGRTVRMLSAIKARGWRAVCADGTSAQADAVLVALPPREAQSLLTVVAPSAAELLGRISMASISTWHSRHPWNCALEEGFNVVADPRESAPWLGASAWRKEDPRGVPGCLQARIHALSGTGSSEPSKEDGWGRLHDWFPELADPIQIRIEKSQEAILLPAPGHGTLTEAIVQGLPPGLHWIGTGRFDPGLTGIIEGVEKWACGFPYGES